MIAKHSTDETSPHWALRSSRTSVSYLKFFGSLRYCSVARARSYGLVGSTPAGGLSVARIAARSLVASGPIALLGSAVYNTGRSDG